MTVFRTAYDTTQCDGYVLNKPKDAIAKAFGMTHFEDVAPGVKAIVGSDTFSDAIPAFAHPLLIQDPRFSPDKDKTSAVFVDVRPFGKWDQLQHKYQVRNEAEYDVAVRRARLTSLFLHNSPTMLRDVTPVAMMVYALWISQNVQRRYSLDPSEQKLLQIYAAFFYQCLFIEGEDLPEREKQRMAATIARVTKISAQEIFDVLDKFDKPLHDVREFVGRMSEVTGSIRLQEMNVGLLYQILSGTWFSSQRGELVAVAIEHPPTWIAMLYAAYDERSYQHSGIATIAGRPDSANGREFRQAVANLLRVTAE